MTTIYCLYFMQNDGFMNIKAGFNLRTQGMLIMKVNPRKPQKRKCSFGGLEGFSHFAELAELNLRENGMQGAGSNMMEEERDDIDI